MEFMLNKNEAYWGRGGEEREKETMGSLIWDSLTLLIMFLSITRENFLPP